MAPRVSAGRWLQYLGASTQGRMVADRFNLGSVLQALAGFGNAGAQANAARACEEHRAQMVDVNTQLARALARQRTALASASVPKDLQAITLLEDGGIWRRSLATIDPLPDLEPQLAKTD